MGEEKPSILVVDDESDTLIFLFDLLFGRRLRRAGLIQPPGRDRPRQASAV